jgi:flagellar basal-body rod protein FlgG
MDGFSVAVSALRAAFDRQAVTANNIANVSTPAYQARRVHQSGQAAGGVEIDAVQRDETPGGLEPTGRTLDLAVAGGGYLAVNTPRGMRFTRAGSFGVDGAGRVVNSGGDPLAPGFTVPAGAVGVELSSSGLLSATMPDGSRQSLGQLNLYNFGNTGGLEAVGNGLYSPSASSGPAMPGTPGVGAYGEIVAGFLEGSNVELASELTDQIVNKTALGANLASVKAQDRMLGELLDLKG